MRTIEIKDRTISIDGNTISATWTSELAEDMARYHNIEVSHEIALALLQEINFEMTAMESPLTAEEDEHFRNELLEHFK